MLCVGDDWAEDHHDVELVDERGRRLTRARLPEGLEGVTRLHALIAEHWPPEWAELDPVKAAARVPIGIETERGPWVHCHRTAVLRLLCLDGLLARPNPRPALPATAHRHPHHPRPT